MPRVNPDNLVWARETAGLSPAAAAGKLGLRDSARASALDKLLAFESGASEPSHSMLERMADKYRRPLLAFYLPRRPRRADRGADYRTLPDGRPAADEALLDALVRDLRTRQSMLREAMEDDEHVESRGFVGAHSMADGVSALVSSLERLLDTDRHGYREVSNPAAAFEILRARAEAAGVFVLLKGDLGSYHTRIGVDGFRGLAIADDIAPFIVINDNDARAAWSFTLLHEMAHLLLGHTGIGGVDGEGDEERFCDEVAGEFLFPTSEVQTAAPRIGGESVSAWIERVAAPLNLSRSMVGYRLYRAGFLKKKAYGRLLASWREAWRGEEQKRRERARDQDGGPTFYTVRRHRLGRRITTVVRRLMEAEALSTTRGARILGVKPVQADPLLRTAASP